MPRDSGNWWASSGNLFMHSTFRQQINEIRVVLHCLLSLSPMLCSYGTEKCATAPGVYSDAFNCGIRASSAAIRRAKLDKKTDPCIVRKDHVKRRPVKNNRRPFDAKKFGGVGDSMAETIRVHGCKHNSQCVSNVCREIEACHTLRGGPGGAQMREEDAEFRELPFTEVMQRPVKPINEAVAIAEQPSLFRRQCSKVNVCWLPAWVDSYTSTPVFDFDTIVTDDEEDGHPHGNDDQKKP